jgi:glycosyltransferase involved in cell wall biosynthesis
MKILWFSPYTMGDSYNGGGWVKSLQDELQKSTSIELGVVFFNTPSNTLCKRQKQAAYYSITNKNKPMLKKIFYYWYGYKKEKADIYLSEFLDVIRDFKPDIIQIFGIESPFACILGHTAIPIIVHLQGILNPYYNAFYPQGLNKFTFLLNSFSSNEWILRNGYNFAACNMLHRSKFEIEYFQRMKFAMGRTEWDYQISRLLSPESCYFHVDEILRDEFYNIQSWNIPISDKYIISSTISQTVYKGLDVILKTAKLLKETTCLNFEWRVIGVRANSKYVNFFEKHYGIKAKDVNVKFVGIYNAHQICNSLLETHVYVHPSYIDNSPNSLCEAQLIGLPVIGTYVGGISSLITDKKTGILVPANAPYELSYWLKSLYEHPEMMIALGDSARKTALERHSKGKIVSDILVAYNEILKINN